MQGAIIVGSIGEQSCSLSFFSEIRKMQGAIIVGGISGSVIIKNVGPCLFFQRSERCKAQ